MYGRGEEYVKQVINDTTIRFSSGSGLSSMSDCLWVAGSEGSTIKFITKSGTPQNEPDMTMTRRDEVIELVDEEAVDEKMKTTGSNRQMNRGLNSQ